MLQHALSESSSRVLPSAGGEHTSLEFCRECTSGFIQLFTWTNEMEEQGKWKGWRDEGWKDCLRSPIPIRLDSRLSRCQRPGWCFQRRLLASLLTIYSMRLVLIQPQSACEAYINAHRLTEQSWLPGNRKVQGLLLLYPTYRPMDCTLSQTTTSLQAALEVPCVTAGRATRR